MAVFWVEKTRDYTIMANHHLKDKRLSLKAKGLLSVMLSLPEEWDYTLKGLARISREGVDAIRECIRELEQAGYVARTRQRNAQGQLKGMEYVIYERPRDAEGTGFRQDTPVPESPGQDIPAEESPEPEEPVSALPVLENPTQGNPMLEAPMQEPPAQGAPTLESPTQLNTLGINNKNQTKTQGENPNQSNPNPIKDVEAVRRLVRRNLSYDVISQDTRYPAGQLDEIVDLITEVLCSRRETICVAGNEYPAGLVRERLLRLNSMHVEYVLNCMKQNTTYVHNIKKYLLAALFNAPSTMDSYYAALVNYELYDGPPSSPRYDDDDEIPF